MMVLEEKSGDHQVIRIHPVCMYKIIYCQLKNIFVTVYTIVCWSITVQQYNTVYAPESCFQFFNEGEAVGVILRIANMLSGGKNMSVLIYYFKFRIFMP